MSSHIDELAVRKAVKEKYSGLANTESSCCGSGKEYTHNCRFLVGGVTVV